MPERQVLRWAQQRLSEDHGQPFFQDLGFYRPHLPWFVPQRFFNRYSLSQIKIPDVPLHILMDVPEKGRNLSLASGDHRAIVGSGQWANAIQAYLASLTFADDCLLQLLNSLESSPHRDNNLIVLWTDHGWHFGEKLGWRKFKLWEMATNVPLIIAGPGVARGTRNNSIVSLMDLRPTLADMALGQEASSELGGSLKQHLADPEAVIRRQAVTSWGPPNDRHLTVRTDRWRYILYSDGTEELYDQDVDPKEHTNLLATESAKGQLQSTVAKLRSIIGR